MSELEDVRRRFIESLTRIAEFWGYPRAMGAIYGALYLSPEALSLDELIPMVGVTKGAVSTNVRALEQLGMVHQHIRPGDRKDYYEADTDFWKIAKTMLERRQKPEFDKALSEVGAALREVRAYRHPGAESDAAKFYEERLASLESFFHTLDGVVAMILQVERLRADGIKQLLRIAGKKKKKK